MAALPYESTRIPITNIQVDLSNEKDFIEKRGSEGNENSYQSEDLQVTHRRPPMLGPYGAPEARILANWMTKDRTRLLSLNRTHWFKEDQLASIG